MIRLKSLSIIAEEVSTYVKFAGKKSVLETLPVKSSFKGIGLLPLKADTLVLTANAEKFNSQAERLKAFYNSKDYPYLLPHEEWSDKKIFDAVDVLGKNLDRLFESNKLNKKSIQEAVNNLAPGVKGNIKIKDFADLEKDLRIKNCSEEEIGRYLSFNALASCNAKDTSIYLKFEQLNEGKNAPVLFKSRVEHEVKHALSSRLQNTRNTDTCKNSSYKCIDQNEVFNKIFNHFEKTYNQKVGLRVKEVTQQKLLNWVGFDSIADMHGDFEKTLNTVVRQEKATGAFNLGSDKNAIKQFLKSLKNMAKDEKEAYQSGKRFREVYGDLNVPTTGELKPLFYDELGKFFAQKGSQVNKQSPLF